MKGAGPGEYAKSRVLIYHILVCCAEITGIM